MRFISSYGPTATGHRGPITSVEWSPDGAMLATGSYDGLVIVWKGDDPLEAQQRFAHPRLINGVRWSPSGEFLAAACADGNCHVWNVSRGERDYVLSRHTDDVNTLAWSPDGRHVATVSEDATGRLWHLPTDQLLDAVLVHEDHCMSADWHPDGELLATCGEDSSIRLWGHAGEALEVWPQPGDLEMVRWAPGGALLAATCDDGTVRVLDKTGEVVSILGPHAGAVKSVSWSADGRRLASGAYDASVTVWEATNGEQLARFQGPRLWPRGLHWNPAGDRLAVGTLDAGPAVFRSSDKDTSPRTVGDSAPSLGVNAVVASHAGVLLGLDDGSIRVWSNDNTDTVLSASDTDRPSLINTLAYHSSARVVGYGRFTGEVGAISLDGKHQPSEQSVGAPVNSVAWSPGEDAELAVADYSGQVSLFSLPGQGTGLRLVAQMAIHDAAIKGLAWIDQDRLVTAATDRTLRIVTREGQVIHTLSGHGNLINGVAVTRDADRDLIASVSRDRTIRVWDADSGKCEHVLVGHDESVKAVAWEPGSTRRLVSGSYDFDARIWDLCQPPEDPGHSYVLDYHRQGVGAVAWDEGQVVTSSWDDSVAKWSCPHRARPTLETEVHLVHA